MARYVILSNRVLKADSVGARHLAPRGRRGYVACLQLDRRGRFALRETQDLSVGVEMVSDTQGDEVRAMAVRKVQTVSSTGSSDSFRVRINLTLEVAKVCNPLFAYHPLGILPNILDDILERSFILDGNCYWPKQGIDRIAPNIRQGSE
jgi:hypothetical protein